jgi:23S rRNA pseudouridine1911/1915/1917 synthase
VKPEVVRVTADDAARGQRVDQLLASRVPSLSRSRVQGLIEAGAVTVDGQPTRASHRLKGTEAIEFVIAPPEPAEPQAEALPLRVLFQDKDLLVLDKAAGMVVHPGAGHATGTLVNALLHHVTDLQGIGGTLRPGLVHRLDKDTSGVLVVAKNEKTLTALQDAFKSREVEKVYLALVVGQPPAEGTIRTLYGRHPTQRVRFTGKVKTGKTAVTHYRVQERFDGLALVEVTLETGRTHQIRVHLAEAGFPLVSDALYGPKKAQRPELIGRQALHAARLSFHHPRTKKALTFEAELPPDFARALQTLRG